MNKTGYSLRRSQLKKAALLLIKGKTVREVAKACAGTSEEFPLSTGTVGRLRKYMVRCSRYLDLLSNDEARELAGIFAYYTARGTKHLQQTSAPKKRGRPPKTPAPSAKPVKGVWQKAWASASGLGIREIAAAANGSPIGRMPYVVKLAGPSRLEAHSPGGRRAYLYVAEKPLRPMTLAKALAELRKRTGPGLRVYHYDQSLFRSPRMRARLGEATFVALAISVNMTEQVSRKVTLTAPEPRRPQHKPQIPKIPKTPSTSRPVPLAALAADWS